MSQKSLTAQIEGRGVNFYNVSYKINLTDAASPRPGKKLHKINHMENHMIDHIENHIINHMINHMIFHMINLMLF